MKAEPFLLTPAGKDYLWGGSRLKWDFAKDTVSGNMTLYARWTTDAPARHFSLWWLLLLLLLLIAAGIVGSLTAAGGECEEHDGRQQEGGKGSELHGGGFLSCDEVDFSKTGESCFFRVFALPMQTKNKAVNAL